VNRPTLRPLLLLACVTLCAGPLAACGDSDRQAAGSGSSALDETLAATSKLHNGRVDGRLQLAPDGLLSLGGPIVLTVSGPFASPAAGTGPRFDLRMSAAIGGGAFEARASSTGRRAFLRVDGDDYALGRHDSSATKKQRSGALASLGLNPAAWMKDPQAKGSATIDGVATDRISGELDVQRSLADIATLLDGDGAGEGLLTPKLRKQIVDAVTSAKVELWTGSRDRILRQLTAAIDFAFADGAERPITGLDGGRINLRLRLTGVDATTFDVATPKNARPLSQLVGDGGLGGLLSAIGGSFGGAAGPGDGGAAFLRCITAAGGKSAAVMRCASRLTP